MRLVSSVFSTPASTRSTDGFELVPAKREANVEPAGPPNPVHHVSNEKILFVQCIDAINKGRSLCATGMKIPKNTDLQQQ
jgi:hypothetical protein